ncbi:hypothetical protein HMPREF1584_00484 [Gardnerella vaginalis JCP8481A]|uniref:Uncharacterized protein n=1 Tax=Gardnerella vaginalis TaxID=2702 RepID=A0A133NYV4_GARVA|nr:hypothetical protein HMPREF1584_00484 [Gardnerella vaginalis JCP8481A]EPI44659.1 hypothetical protein HMPREF1585_00091 [Gardnerella vaginalis JCP8481B]KXA21464.1 hypothetical protein HMPREF3208_00558 [Gardnerella vaginalis]
MLDVCIVLFVKILIRKLLIHVLAKMAILYAVDVSARCVEIALQQ